MRGAGVKEATMAADLGVARVVAPQVAVVMAAAAVPLQGSWWLPY